MLFHYTFSSFNFNIFTNQLNLILIQIVDTIISQFANVMNI